MICRYNYCSYAVDNLFFSRYFFRIYHSIWIPLRGCMNKQGITRFFVFIMRMAFTGIVHPPHEVHVAGFFLWLWGSFEILERNKQSLMGALCTLCFCPRRQKIPPVAIIIRRQMENQTKRGGKGMQPLGCHPHWGREGVTLRAAAENKRTTEEKGIQQIRLQGSFQFQARNCAHFNNVIS